MSIRIQLSTYWVNGGTSRFGGKSGDLRIYTSGFLPAGHSGPHLSLNGGPGLLPGSPLHPALSPRPGQLSQLLHLGTVSGVNARLEDKRFHYKKRGRAHCLSLRLRSQGLWECRGSLQALGEGFVGRLLAGLELSRPDRLVCCDGSDDLFQGVDIRVILQRGAPASPVVPTPGKLYVQGW